MPPTQVPFRPCRPTRLGGWLALLCALLWAKLPAAEEAARRHYDIPAGSAVVTLKRAAHQGGLEIVYSAAVVEGVEQPRLLFVTCRYDATIEIGKEGCRAYS